MVSERGNDWLREMRYVNCWAQGTPYQPGLGACSATRQERLGSASECGIWGSKANVRAQKILSKNISFHRWNVMIWRQSAVLLGTTDAQYANLDVLGQWRGNKPARVGFASAKVSQLVHSSTHGLSAER